MGATQSNQAALRSLLAQTTHLLLDFDGPVCSIFAGLPDTEIAGELAARLGDDGIAPPASLARAHDPFEFLGFAATLGRDDALRLDSLLQSLELEAVKTAEPTPGAEEVLEACRESSRPVAIVSNNSSAAVRAYLAAHELLDQVVGIVGRDDPDPGLLKPSPYLILKAVRALGARPAGCTLVGDSISDIDGARLAEVPSIGYANKAGKRRRLEQAGARAIISSMGELARALRAADDHA